jgi:hypothetical protein
VIVMNEIEIEGLSIRLRPLVRVGQRRLTYFDVWHGERWLDCGDPMHGALSSKAGKGALAHYARVTIRNQGARLA